MIKGINKRIKKHGYHIQEEPCLLIFMSDNIFRDFYESHV